VVLVFATGAACSRLYAGRNAFYLESEGVAVGFSLKPAKKAKLKAQATFGWPISGLRRFFVDPKSPPVVVDNLDGHVL
jgi:hypothetical protein